MPKRGRGCGRGRGRGRGRGGKGASQAPSPPPLPPAPPPLIVAGPSTRTYEEEKALVLKNLAATKKQFRSLQPEARNVYVSRKRAKHLERFLLPDAPPRKQIRKESPTRTVCRLSDDTPLTPPARKLMQWEIIDDPDLIAAEPSEVTPPRNPAYTRNFGTPTSTVSFDSIVEVPGHSPLHVNWKTGNLKTNALHQNTPTSSRPTSAVSARSLSYSKKEETNNGHSQISQSVEATPVYKKVVITGLDYGTKKAEDIFDNWCKELEDESDLDESEEENNSQTAARMDANLEAADLPQNISQEARQWLNNEDAEADRTIQQMLPIDHLTFEWDCDPKTFKGQREVFTATPGPTFDIDDDTTPLTIFQKYFDDDLIDLIVRQTNKHSNILIDKVTKENSRLLKWKNTDRAEVIVFLAMLILQGLAPLNVEYDYWRENGYLTLKYFKQLMSFGRFVLIKRLLHFTDSQTDLTGLSDSQRKLRKILPVSDALNEKFRNLYIPKQNIAIDESLLKWHGRLSFAQKIATKAAKTGIKSYELCESDTGYLWSFFIYAGKEVKAGPTDEQTEITDDIIDLMDLDATNNDRRTKASQQTTASASSMPPPPQNATAQIVQNLAKPLLGKGYTLIMDNFYNSPLLARYLKSQKTDCFGTLRVNREFVPEAIKCLAKSEMRVGEVAQTFSRDLGIMLWRDTNVVSMITTFHGGSVGGKEKYGKYKYKPEVVCDYNHAMGGVDKKDQLLSAHPIERARNQAWYKKVFRRLLNVTIHNSYVIFKTRHPTITSRAFRQQLAEEMVKAYKTPEIPNTLQVKTKLMIQGPGEKGRAIIQGNHFVGLGPSKYARCEWCHRSRTKYICKQCGASLCFEICFEEYHTKL